jgi:hypothetical protein
VTKSGTPTPRSACDPVGGDGEHEAARKPEGGDSEDEQRVHDQQRLGEPALRGAVDAAGHERVHADADQERADREDPEPDDGLERADVRQAHVAEEVRLPEAVERLARHPPAGRDPQHQQEDGAGADEAGARDRGLRELAQPLPRPPRRCEPLFRHQEVRERLDERERAAQLDREPQRVAREGDASHDPEDRADVADARPAQERAADLVRAELVGQPGLVGADEERRARAPDGVAGEDDRERRRRAEEHDPQPLKRHADCDREPPGDGVREDAGRHAEQEVAQLHHGAVEHELQRREVRLADEVDGCDGERERPRQ